MTIPDSVTSIEDGTFSGCKNLTSVTFKGNAPMIGSGVFDSVANGCTAYVKKGSTGWGVDIPGMWNGIKIEYAGCSSSVPSIEGDDDAVVECDSNSGYTIKPNDGKTDVVVIVPNDIDTEKVTIEVPLTVKTVNAGGADIKIEVIGVGGNNTTEYLDIPAADSNGIIDMTKTTVKEFIIREVLDMTKEEVNIDLTPSNPSIETANTRPGLKYTFAEGRTIEELATTVQYKWGDGTPFKPTPSVTGGKSAFYTVTVEK